METDDSRVQRRTALQDEACLGFFLVMTYSERKADLKPLKFHIASSALLTFKSLIPHYLTSLQFDQASDSYIFIKNKSNMFALQKNCLLGLAK